jgi:hypothetical protein
MTGPKTAERWRDAFCSKRGERDANKIAEASDAGKMMGKLSVDGRSTTNGLPAADPPRGFTAPFKKPWKCVVRLG